MKETVSLNPATFLRAAELIDSRRKSFACYAIRQAKRQNTFFGPETAEESAFHALYRPAHEWHDSAYFTDPELRDGHGSDRNRSHRVFALLLAHEIAKDTQSRTLARKREARRVAGSIRINVSKEDIASGHRFSPRTCAIARAAKRKLGFDVLVSPGFDEPDFPHGYIKNPKTGEQTALPKAARKFIVGFDTGNVVRPFSFRVPRF